MIGLPGKWPAQSVVRDRPPRERRARPGSSSMHLVDEQERGAVREDLLDLGPAEGDAVMPRAARAATARPRWA